MVTANRIAEVAQAISEPARAAMLTTLMDGRALTAAELASVAGITPQTASTHLAKLLSVQLVRVEVQGRHRYHRLAGSGVAHMLEGLMQHVSEGDLAKRAPRTGPRDTALRKARTCYDHFAGQLGVALADALVERGLVELNNDAGMLTKTGIAFFGEIGIDIDPLVARGSKRTGRVLCRPCLDWSERRPHLAGSLGAALCAHSMEQGWTRHIKGTRAVDVTPKGEQIMRDRFGMRSWPVA